MPITMSRHRDDMLLATAIDNHALKNGAPPGTDGQDRGPASLRLMFNAPGSCVAALITDFCDNHGPDPNGLEVEVSFRKAGHLERLLDIRVTARARQ